MDIANNRILIIDDNPAIHEDFRKILAPDRGLEKHLDDVEAKLFGAPVTTESRGEGSFEIDTADQGKEGLAKVQQAVAQGRPYALAFVDMRMPPGWDGVQTLKALWEADPELQAVICTAYSDYSWLDIKKHLGNHDNLLILKKPFDTIEVLQLSHALTRKWELGQKAKMKIEEMESHIAERTAALQQSEQRLSTVFQNAPLAMAVFRYSDGQCIDANPAFCRLTGASRERWTGASLSMLQTSALLDTLRGSHPLSDLQIKLARSSDSGAVTAQQPFTALVHTQNILLLDNQPHLLVMLQDISDKAELQQQLQQAQKMEAVGQLAAGVAHDFNNILTIIQGHIGLHLQKQGPKTELQESLSETMQAATRAASLTRQLLTFSRKHLSKPEPLDLNQLIANQCKLMARLLGDNITIEASCAADLPPVKGDAPTLEQVVMNLAINARDAMSPQGGTLSFTTRLAHISPEKASQIAGSRAGTFVQFSVADTGHGMDEATMQRIFEPFFTTKGIGAGTGMGLATTYAIINHHQGWMNVASQTNQGTRFDIYLPISQEPLPQARPESGPLLTGHLPKSLTILLVEDEPAVRSIVCQMLSRSGCQVIQATDAKDGYQKWSEHRGKIDILMTDLQMPGSESGEDLARKLQSEDPNLAVIYSSGYSSTLFKDDSVLVPGENFLAKPYDAPALWSIIDRAHSSKANGSAQPSLSS